MPRIINNAHENNSRHSGYHTNLLSNSHQVLERIATNTENINVNIGDVEINTNDLEVLQTATNSKLDVIDNVLDAILVDSDAIDSSLNTIEAQSVLTASRLNNIQNWVGTADGAGGGDKLGVIASNILAKNTEIESSANTINTTIGTGNTTLSTMNTNIVATNSKLDTLDGSINTLEACVGSNKVNVNISSGGTDVSALATHVKQDTLNTSIGTVNTSVGSLITANHTDLVALEASLTSMETKQDTQVTHLSEIEGAVETLEACVGSNKVNVNISSGGTDVSSLATHAKQDTLNTSVGSVNTSVGSVNTSVGSLITANHTDLVALEASLTSMEGKQDTQVTHLSEIEGAVETLEACVGSNKVNVNISSGGTDVSGLSTHAKQDTIIGHLDGVEGKLDTLETTLTEIATDGNNIQTLLSTLDGVQDNVLTKLGEIETSADALIAANHTDLVALETSLTSMETKQDTQVTHLSEIEGAVETLEACVGSNKVNVNISSGGTDVSGLSTHAKQDTIIGHLDGVEGKLDAIETTNNACQVLLGTIDSDTDAIKTAVEIIDNAISGNEMQCDIVAALPAGTNNIGVVTANLSSTDNAVLDDISQKIGDVETAVQTLESLVKAEDAAHSSGDKGVMALAVHQTAGTLLGANGDYTPLSVNVNSHLRSTQELQTFAFTLPSSGTIGASAMGETDVFQFHHKVNSFTLFVGSNNTAAFSIGFVVMGSTDGSSFFTLNSSLYASSNFNDSDKMNYATFINFNVKFIKIQVTNNSSSSDTFLVSICA